MLKKNKFKIVISSLIILLPILFGLMMWNDLPDTMTTHWGADGHADGFGTKAFAVFGNPVILLVLHILCLLLTLSDKKQRAQNPKALGMVFWILPATSLVVNAMMYAAALGKEFDLSLFIPALLGIMFIFMGNYMPKVKQNRTLGVKIPWTLNNEENWNRTHRLCGKVWVAGGFLMLFSIFLPPLYAGIVMACVVAAAFMIPTVYSYHIYRVHQKQGVAYAPAARSKAERRAIRISSVIVIVILIATAILMFSGDIQVHCTDTSFQIDATYWTDLEVAYARVDTMAYRTDLDVGMRTNGFGSPRLSMGVFENEEFGSYILYAYTGAKAFIVLTSDGETLVIGMKDAEDTRALYDTILEKTGAQIAGAS